MLKVRAGQHSCEELKQTELRISVSQRMSTGATSCLRPLWGSIGFYTTSNHVERGFLSGKSTIL